MVQPNQPWPQEGDALRKVIEDGNLQQVRAFFDQVFWEGREVDLAWPHLKAALLRQDRALVNLLVIWGASATDGQLAELRGHEQIYSWSVDTLRRCGLNVRRTPGEEKDSAEEADEDPASEQQDPEPGWDKLLSSFVLILPQEWRIVLDTFQLDGAPEAVIAGGALRDLFNDRPVKDVDIFLKSQGSEKKNKKFLKKAFENSGLEIKKQLRSRGYSHVAEAFPDPKNTKLFYKENSSHSYGPYTSETGAESWTVIAGPRKTEYNIIFVNEKSALPSYGDFSERLICCFDFGLCQIACDGKKIIATQAYMDDVKNKKITLIQPNYSSKEHFERIAEKYPDWQAHAEPQKPSSPNTGERMPDGSIYLGFYKGKDWYVAAATVRLDFNQAARYAKQLNEHGHDDWKVPDIDILQEMFNHKSVGSFEGTYEFTNGFANYHWSSTPNPDFPGLSRQMNLTNGTILDWIKDASENVRCVRSEPRPFPSPGRNSVAGWRGYSSWGGY